MRDPSEDSGEHAVGRTRQGVFSDRFESTLLSLSPRNEVFYSSIFTVDIQGALLEGTAASRRQRVGACIIPCSSTRVIIAAPRRQHRQV